MKTSYLRRLQREGQSSGEWSGRSWVEVEEALQIYKCNNEYSSQLTPGLAPNHQWLFIRQVLFRVHVIEDFSHHGYLCWAAFKADFGKNKKERIYR